MLEELDQIDWQNLGAARVPEWLRAFTSSDDEIRQNAYDSLEGDVLKADIFDGYYSLKEVLKNNLQLLIVPFLLDLLRHDKVRDKDLLISLLFTLSSYSDIANGEEPYNTYALEIRRAVANGIETYINLASDSDPIVRDYAIRLIRRFPEYSSRLAILLLNRISIEDNPKIKGFAMWMLHKELANSDESLDRLTRDYQMLLESILAHSSEDKFSAIVAAVCLANQRRIDTLQTAITIIADALLAAREIDTYLGFDWDYDLYRFSHALTIIGKDRGISVLTEIVQSQSADILNVVYALNALLHLAFREGELENTYVYVDTYFNPILFEVRTTSLANLSAERLYLTDTQRSIVRLIVNNDRLWEVRTNLFEFYGLPNSREEMQRLLDSK